MRCAVLLSLALSLAHTSLAVPTPTDQVDKRQFTWPWALPTNFPSWPPRASSSSTTSSSVESVPASTTSVATVPSSTAVITSPTATPTSTSGSGFTPDLPSSAGSSTSNDLVNGACKAITLIFGRGTSEAGNMGSVVGPPLAKALTTKFGAANVAIQGVDYAATTAGFTNDAAGNQKVADLINQASTACPGTQIVLSGYSQGCMIAHRGANTLSTAATSKVAAVLLFGDPFNNQPFSSIDASKVDSFCASGDSVCENGNAVITSAHLSYGKNGDVDQGVDFVASKISI